MSQWQDDTWRVAKGMATLQEVVSDVRSAWNEARQDIHDLANRVEDLEARIAAGEAAQGELLQIAQEMRDAVPDEPPIPVVSEGDAGDVDVVESPAEPVPVVDDAGGLAEPSDMAAEPVAEPTESQPEGEPTGETATEPETGAQTPDEAAAGGEPEHPEGSILNP